MADARTIRLDCHPILTNWCPTSAIPTIFMPDTLPGTTLPIYPGLGQAPNMLACIPGGLVIVVVVRTCKSAACVRIESRIESGVKIRIRIES